MVASIAEAKSHNVPPAIIQNFWRQIRDAQREKEEASAGLARVKKAAKAAGLDLGAIKALEGYNKLDDDVLEVFFRKQFEYATVLGMPFATQLSMFAKDATAPDVDDRDMEAHKIWEFGEAGLKAGRDGEPASENPCPLGSPGYVEWAKKHTAGLAERAAAARMQSTEHERPADKADATKRAGQGRQPVTKRAKAGQDRIGALN